MKHIHFLTFKHVVISSAFACTMMSMIHTSAQVCGSPSTIVYGMTNAGAIHPIQVSTGAVGARINPAFTGNPAQFSNGIGYNTSNTRFYFFKRSADSSPQEFVSYKPSSGAVVILSSCPTTNPINVGCVTADGKGFYCWDQDGILYYFDIAGNAWTTITSVIKDRNGVDVSAIIRVVVSGDVAVDGNGDLLMLLSIDNKYALYRLPNPPTTAVASVTVQEIIPVSATPGGVKFVGIAWNATGEILLNTNGPANQMFRLENNLTLTLLSTFSTSMGDLTSCNFPFSLLPVSFENFSAKLLDGNVLLAWNESKNEGVRGYAIQYSTNGKEWSDAGYLKQDDRAYGSYSFFHTHPGQGLYYYRIRIDDVNKQESYSSIKQIQLGYQSSLSVWPNPVQNTLKIYTGGNRPVSGKAFLLDQAGKEIKLITISGAVSAMDVRDVTPGNYFVRVQLSNGEYYTRKLVKTD